MTTRYIAADASAAVDLEDAALEGMLQICRDAGRLETGGVLVGRYTEFGDRVIVQKVTGPPRDSRRFPAAFIRGFQGLAARLRREWEEGSYYVGEWHFHPYASPTPSGTDRKQVRVFAADMDLRCPHPVLIVLGGNPTATWSLDVEIGSPEGLIRLTKKSPSS